MSTNLRDSINGPRKVQTGNVIYGGLTQEQVDVIMKDLKNSECRYEQHGVSGDYKIIEFCGDPKESDYVS